MVCSLPPWLGPPLPQWRCICTAVKSHGNPDRPIQSGSSITADGDKNKSWERGSTSGGWWSGVNRSAAAPLGHLHQSSHCQTHLCVHYCAEWRAGGRAGRSPVGSKGSDRGQTWSVWSPRRQGTERSRRSRGNARTTPSGPPSLGQDRRQEPWCHLITRPTDSQPFSEKPHWSAWLTNTIAPRCRVAASRQNVWPECAFISQNAAKNWEGNYLKIRQARQRAASGSGALYVGIIDFKTDCIIHDRYISLRSVSNWNFKKIKIQYRGYDKRFWIKNIYLQTNVFYPVCSPLITELHIKTKINVVVWTLHFYFHRCIWWTIEWKWIQYGICKI